MSYRTQQFVYALAIAAGGITVGLGLVVKVLWDAIDEAIALPRLPR